MANTPRETQKSSFIIKKYPAGKFSGELDLRRHPHRSRRHRRRTLRTCFRREGREGPLILVGAGSGMSPVWSILNDHPLSGEVPPGLFLLRRPHAGRPLHLERIEELVTAPSARTFIPVLSHAADDSGAGQASAASFHERVDAWLSRTSMWDGNGDVYARGPPPMIERALQPVLFMNGFETERIFFDRSRRRPRQFRATPGPGSGTDAIHLLRTREREPMPALHRVPLGSGAAGAAIFADSDSRRYRYFEPAGQRATHYEDVTVDVQPDPERYRSRTGFISLCQRQGRICKGQYRRQKLQLA